MAKKLNVFLKQYAQISRIFDKAKFLLKTERPTLVAQDNNRPRSLQKKLYYGQSRSHPPVVFGVKIQP